MAYRGARQPKRGRTSGRSPWEGHHTNDGGYYEEYYPDAAPRGRGRSQSRGGGRARHNTEYAYSPQPPPPNYMPYQAWVQQPAESLPAPAEMYATFVGKAQPTMPVLNLKAGGISGVKPCFKHHLMLVLTQHPQKIPHILSRHHLHPDQQYKMQYIDCIFKGCTDSGAVPVAARSG